MKLPDFKSHNGLNKLREMMGAELIELELQDAEWNRINFQLEHKGIDVEINEVQVLDDFSFEYKGQKVVVYIRDQHARYWDKGKAYKYHLSQCSTLDDMRSRGRYNRYVVTNRADGKFIVNLIGKSSNFISEGIEKHLLVCKNCISTLQLGVTPDSFSLDDFFRKSKSQIRRLPQHTDLTAPINIYPSNWRSIANDQKEQKNWQCQQCKRSFSLQKELLHVHHRNGDKSNNHTNNLEVLCIVCHAEKPGHEHMKATPDYKDQAKSHLTASSRS